MQSELKRIRFSSRLPGLFFTVSLLLFCYVRASTAQQQEPNLPDAVKFVNKFDMVANAVRAVLKEQYDIEMPKVRNLHSVKNIYTIAAILNNVHILQKATSQSTQTLGEEDPQNLEVLRV